MMWHVWVSLALVLVYRAAYGRSMAAGWRVLKETDRVTAEVMVGALVLAVAYIPVAVLLGEALYLLGVVDRLPLLQAYIVTIAVVMFQDGPCRRVWIREASP